jgi:flagellar biosynthesis/type III secretory pathway protein FliH
MTNIKGMDTTIKSMQLWDKLEDKSWENLRMKRIEIFIDVKEYLALKKQFKEMHQEEITRAYQEGYSQGYAKCEQAEDYYYEKTYEKNKEQQCRQLGE